MNIAADSLFVVPTTEYMPIQRRPIGFAVEPDSTRRVMDFLRPAEEQIPEAVMVAVIVGMWMAKVHEFRVIELEFLGRGSPDFERPGYRITLAQLIAEGESILHKWESTANVPALTFPAELLTGLRSHYRELCKERTREKFGAMPPRA